MGTVSEKIVARADDGRVLVQTGMTEHDEPIGYVRFPDGSQGPEQLLLSYIVRGNWAEVA